MKKIEAYIKSHRVDEVVDDLRAIEGLTGLSLYTIRGFGRQRNAGKSVHLDETTVSGEAHVKLEVFCTDVLTETVIAAIQKGAHTGLRADGKIYVMPVEDAVRISTGQRGEEAV
jgi:nitrogen regulatory protein PII